MMKGFITAMFCIAALMAYAAANASGEAAASASPGATQIAIAILAVAVAVSEALSLIPSVKANGIFQAIYMALKKLQPK